MKYPLARDGIFRTVQGEGTLLGVPMTFVRLAGCSVGCPECDTDYRKHESLTAAEIKDRVLPYKTQWTWVTGGEPADHNLGELLDTLRLCGYVALATSGHRPIGYTGRLNFLSVSPHGKPDDLVVKHGSQLNLVPGLNGLKLAWWQDVSPRWFDKLYVTPLYGSAESLAECLAFLEVRPDFRLGVQAHRTWGLP